MLRILAAVTGLLVFCSMNAHALQPTTKKGKPKTMTLREAIEFVRPSVVQISVEIDQSPNPSVPIQVPRAPVRFPLGTGFFVSADGYVVTARHVVQTLQTIQIEGRKRLLVRLALPNLENFKVGGSTIRIRGSFASTECEVVDEDARHDLALLKLKENPFKGEMGTFMKAGDRVIDYPHRVATLSTARPEDGDAIAVSGYPFSSTVLITTSGNLASSWAYEIEEVKSQAPPFGSECPTRPIPTLQICM